MLLTKKSEYAMLALVIIAKSEVAQNADVLSAQLNISKSFLAKILQNLAKQNILKSFKGVNGDITGTLKAKDDLNIELASRDEVISKIGYRPTKEYIEQTYNIKVNDVQEDSQVIANSKLFHLSKDTPEDELEYQTNNIDTKKALTFQKQILKVIENSTSYEDIQDKLLEIYPNIDTKDLEEILFNNIANSEILARVEIENENGNS